MPARLSSLLVRDGLVGVKRMEKAFQRQVIYGGTLDTILLEMSLVPEDRLTQYLALASGLPPAARDEGGELQVDALALISREQAQRFRAVPLAIEGDVVRVLVCAPLEISELEDLADLLDRPLQPLITPEYRWNLVFASAYGLDPPARFTTLARALDVDAPPPPVGRGTSVIVEEVPPPHWSAPGSGPAISRTMSPGALRTTMPGTGVPERAAAPPTRPQPAQPPPPPSPPEGEPPRAPQPDPDHGRDRDHDEADHDQPSPTAAELLAPIDHDEPTLRIESPGAGSDSAVPDAASTADDHSRRHRQTMLGVAAHKAVTETLPEPRVLPIAFTMVTPARPRAARAAQKRLLRPETAPVATPEALEELARDTPLPVARARELLAIATDRDHVFQTLLRACRSRARYAGVMTIQGNAAIGRTALAESGIDPTTIASVTIPLDVPSPFATAVTNQQPHVGTITTGDPAIDQPTRKLGGTSPPSALILPIVLRERTVAIVIAHRLHHGIKLADVTELLPLASATADALSRLIVRHKSAGYRAPTDAGAPPPTVDAAQVDSKRTSRDAASWRVPEAPVGMPPVIIDAPPVARRPIDAVLDDLEAAPEGAADAALAEAVERAAEALGALMKRFPGKLRIERFAVAGRALRAAQYGGLLELVVRLGAAASELLVDKMSAPQRDVRYFATVCAAELRPRSAIYTLVERLFDQDFGVRAMAIEALGGYPTAELGTAMARARRAVRSSDAETVLAAANAIVELGDVQAVGELIAVVETSGRSGEHARRALSQLTAQDFGGSERKWRKWWDGAKSKHRVEWLIEGLSHKEDAIRASAIADLRRLTGEYFGYHHDLPRKERDASAERWLEWWHDAGQRRFAKEDERARPTAILPARHTPD